MSVQVILVRPIFCHGGRALAEDAFGDEGGMWSQLLGQRSSSPSPKLSSPLRKHDLRVLLFGARLVLVRAGLRSAPAGGKVARSEEAAQGLWQG